MKNLQRRTPVLSPTLPPLPASVYRLETAFLQAESSQDQSSLELLFVIYKEMVHFCHLGLTEELLEERHFECMLGALECK